MQYNAGLSGKGGSSLPLPNRLVSSSKGTAAVISTSRLGPYLTPILDAYGIPCDSKSTFWAKCGKPPADSHRSGFQCILGLLGSDHDDPHGWRGTLLRNLL